MAFNLRLLSIPFISTLLGYCQNQEVQNLNLTLEDRLHNAYIDVIEPKQENIRPLVNLTHEDEKVTWNECGEKVLLFTLHRYPSSYVDGEEITITWSESWLCSVKELQNWYVDNADNIKDSLLRVKQLLGMSHESQNTYISSMWIEPEYVKRPAYITNPTSEMKIGLDENETEEYKQWFINQYYYSYEKSKLPWTRLGYTYDWSEEAKDKYGLSEFVAFKGSKATVDKTLLVDDFLKTLI